MFTISLNSDSILESITLFFSSSEMTYSVSAISKFFSTFNAVMGEVMRHKDQKVAEVAAREALRLYRRGILFDHDYDDSDSTKLYCSELVERAYLGAGVSLAEERRHDFIVPGFHFEHVIMPTDIYESSMIRTISRF